MYHDISILWKASSSVQPAIPGMLGGGGGTNDGILYNRYHTEPLSNPWSNITTQHMSDMPYVKWLNSWEFVNLSMMERRFHFFTDLFHIDRMVLFPS